MTTADDSELLLQAYLDGELGPVDALAVEQRLAADPRLAAQRERIIKLQSLMREQLSQEPVPPNLRNRIENTLKLRGSESRLKWRALAASIVLVVASSGATWLFLGSQHIRNTRDAIIADHIRALMAPQPADIISTDQHTVKPWFNGRIPQAPHVVDLASQGFPLVGGRIDVVDRTPVPTLVYGRRKHLISLTAVPKAVATSFGTERSSNDGYNIVRWNNDGAEYWAISDVAAPELEQFVQLFRSHLTNTTEAN
jgi:anti-sigma factor RsiW